MYIKNSIQVVKQTHLLPLSASMLKPSEMNLVLIISIVLIGRWGLVESLWQCPFPGIPSNGLAWNDRNESVTWENRSNIFLEGQQVRYYCLDQPDSLAGEINCKSNGKWDGPVPLCGMFVEHFYEAKPNQVPFIRTPSGCKVIWLQRIG